MKVLGELLLDQSLSVSTRKQRWQWQKGPEIEMMNKFWQGIELGIKGCEKH